MQQLTKEELKQSENQHSKFFLYFPSTRPYNEDRQET